MDERRGNADVAKNHNRTQMMERHTLKRRVFVLNADRLTVQAQMRPFQHHIKRIEMVVHHFFITIFVKISLVRVCLGRLTKLGVRIARGVQRASYVS